MEFVIGNYRNANGLLSRGFQLFPSEWKLLLEQIHQLVGKNKEEVERRSSRRSGCARCV